MLKQILFPDYPSFPNCRQANFDELLADGLTMGTLYIGRQGTGKTSSLARHIVDYFKAHPNNAVFVLDWSGSITDAILSLISRDPSFESLSKRIVYDELGNPDWVLPLPEFSHIYGSSSEEQVQRLSQNLIRLAPELVKDAPFVAGLALREIAPEIFRAICAISNGAEVWQVTEVKKLITNPPLLRQVLAKYGHKFPQAKFFLEGVFLPLSNHERELRTYAILALLGAIESPEARARVGSSIPAWTPREAMRNGLMVLVNGGRLINQRNTQHYLFTQAYSLIMAEMNKRQPGNSVDRPVALVMDEVYSLISIPGMAEEVGMLAPLYRSRKLELYIVLQSLSQLAPILREQIWSIGNVVSFALSNFQEAYEVAQQLFPYDPQTIKLSAKSDTSQPLVEPDRGQYLQIANSIQRLKHRECIIRRFSSEQVLEKYILWVRKTRDMRTSPPRISLSDFKDKLLRERGLPVKEALKHINQRSLKAEKISPPQV